MRLSLPLLLLLCCAALSATALLITGSPLRYDSPIFDALPGEKRHLRPSPMTPAAELLRLAHKRAQGIGSALASQSDTKIPAVVVPGVGGSRLQAWLKGKPTVPHFWCKRTTSTWFDLWVTVESLLPRFDDCTFDNMRMLWNNSSKTYSNNINVDLRYVAGPAGCTYMDPANAITRSATGYYDILFQAMNGTGYSFDPVTGDAFAAPFDWRLAPVQQGVWVALVRSQVERMFMASGGKRVALISHSMGCLMTHYFLQQQTQAWKDKYLAFWLPSAGPLIGAPVGALALTHGYNMNIKTVPDLAVRGIQREMGSIFWMVPYTGFWQNYPVVVTQNRTYTTQDYPELLRDVDVDPDAFEWVRQQWNVGAPNVTVYGTAGTSVNTVSTIHVGSKGFDGTPTFSYVDGDGTVPLLSASYLMEWQGKQQQPVTLKHFAKTDHMGMARSAAWVQYAMTLLTDPNNK